MAGQHGFARNENWQLDKVGANTVICTLRDNPKTLSAWPNKFILTYTVTVTRGELKCDLKVENPKENERSFNFTTLLHTYFAIGNISTVAVKGFKGLQYTDKLRSGELGKEDREEVTVSSEVDRTYINAPDEIQLKSENGMIALSKSNLPDVVFWNPWIEKSKAMSDFDDVEYTKMVCVELGHVSSPVELHVGRHWTSTQILRTTF
jgi:glucose-6-phosphate 1-epimerase